jgi:hypothetical protein
MKTNDSFQSIDVTQLQHVTGGSWESWGSTFGAALGGLVGGPAGAWWGGTAGKYGGRAIDAVDTPENRQAVGEAAGRVAAPLFR